MGEIIWHGTIPSTLLNDNSALKKHFLTEGLVMTISVNQQRNNRAGPKHYQDKPKPRTSNPQNHYGRGNFRAYAPVRDGNQRGRGLRQGGRGRGNQGKL